MGVRSHHLHYSPLLFSLYYIFLGVMMKSYMSVCRGCGSIRVSRSFEDVVFLECLHCGRKDLYLNLLWDDL